MQGKKELLPKLMYQVHIGALVPQNNFYRLLDRELNLHFLYKSTQAYYGDEGQESIDPVVFFKICLVGYLNNINSDRMHRKLTENKAYAQRMSRLRSSTVEPVLGTLINYLNMKRVNT